jgi:hypothetical protein
MSEIAFTTRLTKEDWDEAMRGWRCQVLKVPGAIVEAIYVDGSRTDSALYEVLPQHAFIRWIVPNKPERVTASIKLTETLSLDRETERWRRLAIVLPVAATIVAASISALATYYSRAADTHQSHVASTTAAASPAFPPPPVRSLNGARDPLPPPVNPTTAKAASMPSAGITNTNISDEHGSSTEVRLTGDGPPPPTHVYATARLKGEADASIIKAAEYQQDGKWAAVIQLDVSECKNGAGGEMRDSLPYWLSLQASPANAPIEIGSKIRVNYEFEMEHTVLCDNRRKP